jgi:DnaJ-class molecular chaperone
MLRQLAPGFVQQVQSVCQACRGKGEVIAEDDKCKACTGERVTKDTVTLDVYIDRGMTHGTKVTFRGQADESVTTFFPFSSLLFYFLAHLRLSFSSPIWIPETLLLF